MSEGGGKYLPLFQSSSPALAWLYLWWGNWRGATWGKRLWRLQVVHEDGTSLSSRAALLRCLAYALAILPLKIGLLPILTDAKRRGWHDQLARTRVIKTNQQSGQDNTRQEAVNPQQIAGENVTLNKGFPLSLPCPHWQVPRRGWFYALLFYALLSVLMTWPLASHFTTHLAGDQGDNMVFAWNYWWFRHALEQGQSVMNTGLLFYPEEISLRFHTLNFFNCVLAFPLQERWGLIATYNFLFLFSLTASAFAAYWLLASLTKDRLASLVTGICFGFSPFFVSHGIDGHLNLVPAQFVALFALFFYSTLATRQFRFVLLSALALALSALCDWQYFLFNFLFAFLLFTGIEIFYWSQNDRVASRKRFFYAANALVLGTLLVLPLLLPMLGERKTIATPSMNKPAFHLDPLDWLKIHPFNPLAPSVFTEFRPEIECQVSPGLTLLLLAGLYLWKRPQARKNLLPWIVTGAATAILACGDHLQIANLKNFNFALFFFLGGLPGNAFGLPWNSFLFDAALIFLSDPLSLLSHKSSIRLPLNWLMTYLPLFKVFRVPARLGLITVLCIMLIAAFALSHWRRQLATQGFRCGWPVLLLTLLTLLAEYATWPYPTANAKISPFYRQLAAKVEHFAIVPLPLVPHTEYMAPHELFQTMHHKSLVAAYTSRAPRHGLRFFNRHELLHFLQFYSLDASQLEGHGPATQAEFALPPVSAKPNFSDAQLQASLPSLRAHRIRYIVIHKKYVPPANVAIIEGALRRLKLPCVWRDNELLAYQIELPREKPLIKQYSP
jgi:hypothetical protein